MCLLLLGLLASLAATVVSFSSPCLPSLTTASGPLAPAKICSGRVIFFDGFQDFNLQTWEHQLGNVNNEFQYYVNDSKNSFAEDGILYIRPSVVCDYENNVETSDSRILEDEGPVKSARIHTMNSFRFRYGFVEVRAKMPAGDWLFPAIWMNPAFRIYGTWPQSGEMDLVESRGNRNLTSNGVNIGTQQAGTTLHFGPDRQSDGYRGAHWLRKNELGFDADFHRYQLEWTPDYMKFSLDDVETGRVTPQAGGFYEFGDFSSKGFDNLWINGTKMAPFDQEFYFIFNVAIGSTGGYFPDGVSNPAPKPWSNNSPTAAKDFWDGRAGWLPTWNLDNNEGKEASLQVDYVAVVAL